MEAVSIGLIPMLIIAAIAWKCGLFNTLTRVVDMANNEVSIQAATHKSTVLKRAADLPDVDAETVAKAKANIAALDSFNL